MPPPPFKNPSASNEERPGASLGKGLSLMYATVARSRLVMVFCVLALIAIAANIKLIADLADLTDVSETVAANQSPDGRSPETATPSASNQHTWFRLRIALLLGTLAVCFGLMIYLLIIRVVIPLTTIIRATDHMAKGNLTVAAPSHYDGEMGELGHVINELAVNFQEVLLLTGTAVGNSRAAVEKLQEALDREGIAGGNDVKEQITELRKDLDMLRSVVKDFQFYQTRFDGRKVVSHGTGTDA
jgi:methyl-accepting chemotaxis protein